MMCGADVCSPSGDICGSSGVCPLATAGGYCHLNGEHPAKCIMQAYVVAKGFRCLPLHVTYHSMVQ